MFATLYSSASRIRYSQNSLSILIYHRVLPVADPLRPSVVDAKSFDSHMQWVAKDFNILSLNEAAMLIKKGQLPSKALCITFDDGYLDSLLVALPILQKYDLIASFFVSSDYIGKDSMWLDQLVASIKETKNETVVLDNKCFDLTSLTARRKFFVFSEEYIKSQPRTDSKLILSKLVADLGGYTKEKLMLDEKDIRTLFNAGMDIGAHGKKHLILSQSSGKEVSSEITDSKIQIERIIQHEVSGFAYPNGLFPDDFNVGHQKMVEEAGYKYAVATNFGCSYSKSELFCLKRFTPWRQSKLGFARGMLTNYLIY